MELETEYLKTRTTVDAVNNHYDFDSCDPDFKADWERLLNKMKLN